MYRVLCRLVYREEEKRSEGHDRLHEGVVSDLVCSVGFQRFLVVVCASWGADLESLGVYVCLRVAVIAVTPVAVVHGLVWHCTALKLCWNRGADSQAVHVEPVVALDAHPGFCVVTSSEAMHETVSVSVSRFADELGIHFKARQASVAAVDSAAICVAESAISHQGVVRVLGGRLAKIIQSVGKSGLTVLTRDVVAVVIDAVRGRRCPNASVSFQF